jgi:uncharacterized protein YbjT (DUF2867 family)
MRILVTTANGKVGSEVVRQLLEKNVDVRVGAHNVEKAQAAFPGTEVVKFDYNDESLIKAALEGVDGIYLAAPGDYPPEPEFRLIDLAKAAGVKRIVKLSALGVENGDTGLRQVEKYLEGSGLEWAFLRPSWFMQNYATMSAAAIKSGTLAEPSGDGKTGFIDARDIAAVGAKLLTEDGYTGKAYPLTGPEVLSRQEIADIISEATGKTVRYLPITDEQFRASVAEFMPADYVELMSMLYGGVRAGWTEVVTPTVREVLGREPRNFRDFANEHRAVWQ